MLENPCQDYFSEMGKHGLPGQLPHGISTDSKAFGNVSCVRHVSCDLAVPPTVVYRSHNTPCATELHYDAIVVLSLADLLSRRL